MRRIARVSSSTSRIRTAQDDYVQLALRGKDFLFSQVSIVSSVQTEPESWLVKPETSKFINANGDGWTNDALRANFGSFIGAYNYVNHVQEPEKAVGFLADAALRRVLIDREANIFIYYVDLLVATSKKKSPDLVRKILTGAVEFLSMGCESFSSTCSCCGHVATDEHDFCEHLEYQKGKYFIDKTGKKRITAELLGNAEPGSCEFIEASWLTEPPAFGGATKRNILPISDEQEVRISMPANAVNKPAVTQFLEGNR